MGVNQPTPAGRPGAGRSSAGGPGRDRLLLLEPYYGGSHQAFADDLCRLLPWEVDLLALPARMWKWRMRLAAPFFARQLTKEPFPGRASRYRAILCTAYLDVAAFKALAPPWARKLPVYAYFHENQFAYPVRQEDQRDLHFGLTNYTTALASDGLAFNSAYNRDSFLAGLDGLLARAPDMPQEDPGPRLRSRARILPPGLDFGFIDRERRRATVREPVIVWNHRWEHDKNPESFFATLYRLAADNERFKLLVLGKGFRRQPAVFAEARQRLADRIIHWGFAADRRRYGRLLRQATVVVSTARHEFHGLAVLEAVRAGCRPVLPARLSYPELFPGRFLYSEGGLASALRQALAAGPLAAAEARRLTEPFAWQALLPAYLEWLESASRPAPLTLG